MWSGMMWLNYPRTGPSGYAFTEPIMKWVNETLHAYAASSPHLRQNPATNPPCRPLLQHREGVNHRGVNDD
jgi:hypothetical protein